MIILFATFTENQKYKYYWKWIVYSKQRKRISALHSILLKILKLLHSFVPDSDQLINVIMHALD